MVVVGGRELSADCDRGGGGGGGGAGGVALRPMKAAECLVALAQEVVVVWYGGGVRRMGGGHGGGCCRHGELLMPTNFASFPMNPTLLPSKTQSGRHRHTDRHTHRGLNYMTFINDVFHSLLA